ncbi:hypothetical protein H0L60_003283 [Salmonella enterica]|nr:hypothetical protein [Salmonella enterica]
MQNQNQLLFFCLSGVFWPEMSVDSQRTAVRRSKRKHDRPELDTQL